MISNKTNKMCSYRETNPRSFWHWKRHLHWSEWRSWAEEKLFRKGYKDKMVQCPQCGRRMVGWAQIDPDDGSVMGFAIPRHKKKGWWKTKKRKPKERKTRMRGAR